MTLDDDPHAWLEALSAEPALDWVRAQNARSIGQLAGTSFETLRRHKTRELGATLPVARTLRRLSRKKSRRCCMD